MNIFILVPSLKPEAPVKGAIALANGLTRHASVSLVSLKESDQENFNALHTDPAVDVVRLGQLSGWRRKRKKYLSILKSSGEKKINLSISFGLQADVFNFLFRSHALLVSSVRGNLLTNYRASFGKKGVLLAHLQYRIVRTFEQAVAMTDAMSDQLQHLGFRRLSKIGNFLDERPLQHYRKMPKKHQGITNIIFVGRLVDLKRPELLVEIAKYLLSKNLNFHIDIVGDGILLNALSSKIASHHLGEYVTLHGHVEKPYDMIRSSDVFILPSISEGVSRAVMESLYLGTPCVLRNVDAADEIIMAGVNGELFNNDDELLQITESMVRNIDSFREQYSGQNLLPDEFSQQINVQKYWLLFKQLHNRVDKNGH